VKDEELKKLGIEFMRLGSQMVGYTNQQAEGAIPNGSAVVKQASEPGDIHESGRTGIVLGSISVADVTVPGLPKARYIYCVRWDDDPRPVFVMDWKIEPKA
jgi:hypothetical protein